MLEIEIDGRKTEVADGSTVMDAAHQLGIFVPHFCYHKKLSIAANCRMCLVQVEKAPKPLPACATPVTNGKLVCAVYATGIVVCFDLEGKRKWWFGMDEPQGGHGDCSSPLIVGGNLLAHFGANLWCFDLSTGKKLWKIKEGGIWGSALPARLGDTDVVITPRGAIARVSDGKVLPSRMGAVMRNSPGIDGDIVY